MVATIVKVGAKALVATKLRVQRDCSVIIELAPQDNGIYPQRKRKLLKKGSDKHLDLLKELQHGHCCQRTQSFMMVADSVLRYGPKGLISIRRRDQFRQLVGETVTA